METNHSMTEKKPTDDVFAIQADSERLEIAVWSAVYAVVWVGLHRIHFLRTGPEAQGLFDFLFPAVFVVLGAMLLVGGVASMRLWEFGAVRPDASTVRAHLLVKTGAILLAIALIGLGVLAVADTP